MQCERGAETLINSPLYPERREGVVLLLSVFMLIMIFGVISAAAVFSNVETKASAVALEETQALYLAESGLEASKWELLNGQDGATTVNTYAGAYTVSVEDLGGGAYRLTASGSSGNSEVGLQEIISTTSTGYSQTFPLAAISIVGPIPADTFLIKNGTYGSSPTKTFVLDGQGYPALTFSDATTWAGVGAYFANLIASDDLLASHFDGTPDADFAGELLPLYESTESTDYVDRIMDFFNEFRDEVTNVVIPAATSENIQNVSGETLGSEASPGTFKFTPVRMLENGNDLTGYGTLVVEEKLIIEESAVLNWNGDLIVFGGANLSSTLEVQGTLNVTGNLIVLSEAGNTSFMDVKPGATVNVNGALTLTVVEIQESPRDQYAMEIKLDVGCPLLAMITRKSYHQLDLQPGQKVHAHFKAVALS